MSLLVLTKLALIGLHGGTLLLQMGLPGQTELVLTTVIMDLWNAIMNRYNRRELWTRTIK